jgi:hypothetical protein
MNTGRLLLTTVLLLGAAGCAALPPGSRPEQSGSLELYETCPDLSSRRL